MDVDLDTMIQEHGGFTVATNTDDNSVITVVQFNAWDDRNDFLKAVEADSFGAVEFYRHGSYRATLVQHL